jgi:hypothetical protein
MTIILGLCNIYLCRLERIVRNSKGSEKRPNPNTHKRVRSFRLFFQFRRDLWKSGQQLLLLNIMTIIWFVKIRDLWKSGQQLLLLNIMTIILGLCNIYLCRLERIVRNSKGSEKRPNPNTHKRVWSFQLFFQFGLDLWKSHQQLLLLNITTIISDISNIY